MLEKIYGEARQFIHTLKDVISLHTRMGNRLSYYFGLLIKKPSVLLRLIKNYLLLFLGQYRLRSVEIDLGYGCQLNCKHCYVSELMNPKRKTMGLEEIKRTIDLCIREGAILFLVSGGEPLIYKQVFDVIGYINRKKAFSCLITNGINLNEETIPKLRKSGLDLIAISLDSGIKDVHDENRNKKGLYEHILKAASFCNEQGITVFTSSIITNKNLLNNDIKKIIELGNQNKIKIHFCFPIAMGNWKDKNVLLTNESRIKAMNLFKDEDIICCEESNYLKQGCSAGVEKICINPYGDVTPCPYIQASFGNIIKENLPSILKLMRRNKYFRKIDGPCLPAFNKKFIKDMMNKINKTKTKPLKFK